MSQNRSAQNSIDALIPILKTRVLPCWERFGLQHLAVTQPTLRQFKAQEPPAQIEVSPKPRHSKKNTARGRRHYNNTNSFLASWPDDHQALFRFPTLIYVLDGCADFHVADYLVRCPQNHFLLFHTDVPRPIGEHAHFEDDADSRYCAVLWFFAPPGTNSVTAYICHSQGQRHWREEGFNFCVVNRAEVIHLFKLFIQELEENSADQGEVTHLIGLTFLHLFLRELQLGQFHRAGQGRALAPGNQTSPIEQAQHYISTHLNQSLTAAKVAQQVYMSRNNFLKHFKAQTGQNFHEFVLQQRLEEARRLLSDGYWSVSFICQFIGLKPTQFRVQFKKRFGLTPSEFRRQIETTPIETSEKVRNR